MAEKTNTLDALTKYVVEKRRMGKSFEEVAAGRGLPVEDVVATWQAFIESRTVMTEAEQRVLYEMRLEYFLELCNERLDNHTRAEDFELVLKTLKQLEEFMALNKERKSDAEARVKELTMQQTQLILGAVLTMQRDMKQFITEAFEQKTIKAIKGTVLNDFDNTFNRVATKALTGTGEES